MKRTLNSVLTLAAAGATMLTGTAIAGSALDDYVALFEAGDPLADLNGDGWVSGDDFDIAVKVMNLAGIGGSEVDAIGGSAMSWGPASRPSVSDEVARFLEAFEAGDEAADINLDGWVTADDFDLYMSVLDTIDGIGVDASLGGGYSTSARTAAEELDLTSAEGEAVPDAVRPDKELDHAGPINAPVKGFASYAR